MPQIHTASWCCPAPPGVTLGPHRLDTPLAALGPLPTSLLATRRRPWPASRQPAPAEATRTRDSRAWRPRRTLQEMEAETEPEKVSGGRQRPREVEGPVTRAEDARWAEKFRARRCGERQGRSEGRRDIHLERQTWGTDGDGERTTEKQGQETGHRDTAKSRTRADTARPRPGPDGGGGTSGRGPAALGGASRGACLGAGLLAFSGRAVASLERGRVRGEVRVSPLQTAQSNLAVNAWTGSTKGREGT